MPFDLSHDMTDYVLEILDGDQAGTAVPLGADRVTLGRRQGNDFVVKDDKCSGQHVEVVREDGGWLLRDLGSTNGTTLDGRRIDEIALGPGDIFVIGRTRILFRAAAAAAGATASDGADGFDDLELRRLDASAMARGGRRRSSLLIVALVVAGVAAAGAFWFRDGGGAGRRAGGPRQTAPRSVSGNLLAAEVANFEGDGGWDLQAVLRGAPFEPVIAAARAHTGTGAIHASRLVEEGGGTRDFAVARSVDEVRILPEQPPVLSGFVRSSAGGAVALRLVFSASGDADWPPLVAGTPPLSSDDWQELRLECAAPPGADRATVEILALLAAPDAAVDVDDVALVQAGSAAPLTLRTQNVRNLVGAGTSLRIEGVEAPTLLGVAPVVDDPLLNELDRLGLAELSDAGGSVRVDLTEDGSGFAFEFDGTCAVGLEFPLEATAVRVAGDDGGFRGVEPDFSEPAVRRLLLGSGAGRALLRFPAATAVRASVRDDVYRVVLPPASRFELVTIFTERARQARALVQQARQARDEGRFAAALDTVEQLLAEVPHDVDRVREAVQPRSEILARQDAQVEALLRDAAEAAFFTARVGHERVLRGIDALVARYGAEHVARIDELRALEERAQAAVAEIRAAEGERHGERLQRLAEAFESTGERELAARLRDYVQRQYGN